MSRATQHNNDASSKRSLFLWNKVVDCWVCGWSIYPCLYFESNWQHTADFDSLNDVFCCRLQDHTFVSTFCKSTTTYNLSSGIFTTIEYPNTAKLFVLVRNKIWGTPVKYLLPTFGNSRQILMERYCHRQWVKAYVVVGNLSRLQLGLQIDDTFKWTCKYERSVKNQPSNEIFET